MTKQNSTSVGGISREQQVVIGIGAAALLISCCACVAAWLVIPVPNFLNPLRYGTQGSPENVARAWMDAIVSGDCATAQELIVPGTRDFVALNRCSSTNPAHPKSARIDSVVIRDFSNHSTVELVGEFPADMSSPNNWDHWKVIVEKIDGKWFVRSDVGPY